MKAFWYLFCFLFLGIPQIFSDAANHLVISEVVYGNVNANDEFVELYNPTDQAINLETYGLKLHIRNSTGTSDTNKTITWTRNTIPAYGFFLLAASSSTSYLSQADATYAAELVSNGAVYISIASGKLQSTVDFISWGSHVMPTGFENQKTSTFNSGQNIERKSNAQGIVTTYGNAWDSDGDDFLVRSTPEPQNSQSAPENPIADIMPPAEVSGLSAENVTTSSANLHWMNPTDADFASILLQKTGESPVNIGTAQTFALINLTPETVCVYTLFTVDVTGNISAGTLVQFQTLAIPLPVPPPDPTQNPGPTSAPDPESTPEPAPDLSPPGQVQNLHSGVITSTSLQMLWNNPTDSDLANILVKIGDIDPVPLGLVNSFIASDLQANTPYIFTFFTEDVLYNRSEGVPITLTTLSLPDILPPGEIQNLHLSMTGFTTLQMQWENPVDTDFSHLLFSYALSGNALPEAQNIIIPTAWTIEGLSPYTTYTVKLQSVDQTGNVSVGSQVDVTTLVAPWISEVFPKTRTGEKEWIEIFNEADTEFPAMGTLICVKEKCITLTQNISAKSFFVLEDGDTSKYTGNWETLTNTSAQVIWKQFQGVEIDTFVYESASVGTSFSRSSSSDVPVKSAHVTRGLTNDFNQIPQAIITIQGAGKNSGAAPFYFNPTGENSTDADGDTLSFSWDFSNGQTSAVENPGGFNFSAAGTFLVTLTVNDGHGGIGTAQQTITVSDSSSGGGGSSSSSFVSSSINKSSTTKVALNITSSLSNSSILFNKISANDSQEDWVEIICKDCVNPTDLSGYQVLDDSVFFTFLSNTLISAKEPVVIKLVDQIRLSTETNLFIVEKKQGLTKTDEQLLLLTPGNVLADAVCWNNQDGKLTEKEAESEAQLLSLGQWKGDCLSSVGLEKKNAVIVRNPLQADTNMLADWFILNDVKPKDEVKKPVTIKDVEIFVSALDIKNTQSDSVTFFCQHCDQDLFGFQISIGTSDVFSFSKGSFVASGELFQVVFSEENEALKDPKLKTFYFSKDSLVGTDFAISLKDTENSVEDFVCWSDRKGTEKREEDLTKSLTSLLEKQLEQKAWKGDCLDSALLEKNDFFVRKTFETHENENSFFTYEKAKKKYDAPVSLSGLTVNELVINPLGGDSKFEWVEFKNVLDTAINTHGWKLHSGIKSYEFPSQELLAGAFLLLPTSVSHLTMKNANSEITLSNPEETVMQKLSYEKTFEGASFSRNTQKIFEWTRVKTPLKENVFLPVQKKLRDSDHDGLDDEFEKQIGTNPQIRDTDGDKCPDGFEFEYNMDPLKFDDHAESAFKTALMTTLSQKVALPKKEKDLLKISGNTEPFAQVMVFVHSTPQTFIVQSDAQGKWQVEPEKLEAGSHFFQIQIQDLAGVITDLSVPVSFILPHAYQKPETQKVVQKKHVSKKSGAQAKNSNFIARQEKLYTSEVQSSGHSLSLLTESAPQAKLSKQVSYWWYAVFGALLFCSGVFAIQKKKIPKV